MNRRGIARLQNFGNCREGCRVKEYEVAIDHDANEQFSLSRREGQKSRQRQNDEPKCRNDGSSLLVWGRYFAFLRGHLKDQLSHLHQSVLLVIICIPRRTIIIIYYLWFALGILLLLAHHAASSLQVCHRCDVLPEFDYGLSPNLLLVPDHKLGDAAPNVLGQPRMVLQLARAQVEPHRQDEARGVGDEQGDGADQIDWVLRRVPPEGVQVGVAHPPDAVAQHHGPWRGVEIAQGPPSVGLLDGLDGGSKPCQAREDAQSGKDEGEDDLLGCKLGHGLLSELGRAALVQPGRKMNENDEWCGVGLW